MVSLDDPVNGLLLPESFLSVADDAGLLIEIDEQVLAEAVKQVASWRRQFADTVSFEVATNVTARHLADERFAQSLMDMVDAANVPNHSLQVEVTERVLHALDTLECDRAQGFLIAAPSGHDRVSDFVMKGLDPRLRLP